jgi:hypothetical protein
VGNTFDAVALFNGASSNTIGGTAASAGNVLSGNGRFGVFLNGTGTGSNLIQGNLIGLNVAGTGALGNTFDGVAFLEGASANTLGGTTPSAGNLISGNGLWGVVLAANNNVLENNLIGTNTASVPGLGNALDGILCEGANNTLGGTAAGAGNAIAGNDRFGVFLVGPGATGNLIQGNAVVANTFDGIALFSGAANNTIGGTAAGAGNLVSGNGRFGVYLNGSGTSNNLVQENLIGLNAAATGPLGNAFDGVAFLEGASANTLGGTTAAARNLISANGRFGVLLGVTGTSNNFVQGNFIGTDASGNVALGNASNGVNIVTGASDNTVGGTVTGAGNTIAYNGGTGVGIGASPGDTGTVRNVMLGNAIHDNASLGIDLGNDGPTPNGSGPNGPNHFQNFVVITGAVDDGIGGVNLTFSLTSTPNQSYRIEFFVNNTADPSGFGQGQRFLGATVLFVPASGNASATIHLAGPGIYPGLFISATTTDEFGDTSEFSADLIVMGVP